MDIIKMGGTQRVYDQTHNIDNIRKIWSSLSKINETLDEMLIYKYIREKVSKISR